VRPNPSPIVKPTASATIVRREGFGLTEADADAVAEGVIVGKENVGGGVDDGSVWEGRKDDDVALSETVMFNKPMSRRDGVELSMNDTVRRVTSVSMRLTATTMPMEELICADTDTPAAERVRLAVAFDSLEVVINRAVALIRRNICGIRSPVTGLGPLVVTTVLPSTLDTLQAPLHEVPSELILVPLHKNGV